MRTIHVIGIGAGDPDYLTVQAIKAINVVDVFFILDKGQEKENLIRLRKRILDEHARQTHRVVEGRDPDRDRSTPAYSQAVEDWRRRRADVCERMILDELPEDQTGAFLVWGDPSLYDSTLAIVEDILARGNVTFDYRVVPGISSVSALAAKHRIGLNRVGRPLQITTGRRLAEGFPDGVDDLVVMLDAHQTFTRFAGEDVDIYWGAYVGTPEELLIAGPLRDVAGEIEAVRREARERHGWIMDTYLLRRTPAADSGSGNA